jgi:mercuric ion binding protein
MDAENLFFRRKDMKRFSMALMLLTTFLAMLITPNPAYAVTNKVILQIEGMTWAAWPLIAKKALEGLDGVKEASISFKTKKGEVYFDPDKVSESEIANKVNQIGFKANVIEK